MSKPKPARYRTTNWSTYNDALRKRGSLLIWLDKEMIWHVPHEGRPGRPPVFSNAAIQFCLSLKVLFKLPLRHTCTPPLHIDFFKKIQIRRAFYHNGSPNHYALAVVPHLSTKITAPARPHPGGTHPSRQDTPFCLYKRFRTNRLASCCDWNWLGSAEHAEG